MPRGVQPRSPAISEVIDAYLGAHHEVDLGAMDEVEAIAQLGLDAEELGVDTIQHLVETHQDTDWASEEPTR